MTELNKKKITKAGLKNAFKLFRYLKPYRLEYAFGMFFLLGSSLANLAFPKLIGDLVNSGNKGLSVQLRTYLKFLMLKKNQLRR